MSIIDNNFADPIISQWNRIGEDKVSKKIENELCTVMTNMFALRQIPDMQYRVQIDGYVEIDIRDEINLPAQFKVDYEMGYVYFHPSKEGEKINVNQYYGRGVSYYPANRVYTKLTAGGDIDETLEDITNKVDIALELSREIQEEENIRIKNEDIRISNEQGRSVSEQERITHEDVRGANEVARENNEVIRVSEENVRVQAEIIRVQNELLRVSNEDERVQLKILLETLKSQLESLKDDITSSESIRIESENTRIDNEDTRVTNESIRVASEQDRADSEIIRKSNEITRIDAEQVRVQAEIIRVQDELIRVSNEEGRVLLKAQLDELKIQLEDLRDGITSGNFGDMFKIVYDTNNNGKVDIAELAEDSEKLEGKTLGEIYADIPEGTTVTDSTTNGNILVNGDEVQVYDDSEIHNNIDNLAGEGRTNETVKDNSDKIGILNGAGDIKEKADKTDLAALQTDFTSHKADRMPHRIKNLKTGRTYRYGYQVSASGIPQIISEEVN